MKIKGPLPFSRMLFSTEVGRRLADLLTSSEEGEGEGEGEEEIVGEDLRDLGRAGEEEA